MELTLCWVWNHYYDERMPDLVIDFEYSQHLPYKTRNGWFVNAAPMSEEEAKQFIKERNDFGCCAELFFNRSIESILSGQSNLYWHPPKPKRTFTLSIDGGEPVELPCPERNVTDDYVSLIYFQNGKARASNDFFFGSEEDCFDFCDKLNQIFESAYPERVK